MSEANQELASRWKRLGGVMLDGLIMFAITIPVMIFAGIFEQAKQGRQMSVGQYIFFFFFGLFIFFIINGFLLAKHGQTVGKKIVGTRIVDFESGQIISIWRFLWFRLLPVHIVSQIPIAGGFIGLADAVRIFGKDKRCFHDLIAGTKVIDVKESAQDIVTTQTSPVDKLTP